MSGFGGVHEEGGRTRRGERRRELASDMARLADARDDQTTANVDGTDEVVRVAERFFSRQKGLSFVVQHVATERKGGGGIESESHCET